MYNIIPPMEIIVIIIPKVFAVQCNILYETFNNFTLLKA